MKNRKVLFIADAAMIAALYAVLTMVLWEISSAGIQFRLSEVLCVLPVFTGAAIPGLTVGCMIANMLGGTWIDVVFGSLATLLASVATYYIGKMFRIDGADRIGTAAKILAPLPPVIFNALIIPFVLYFGYGLTEAFGATGMVPVLLIHALTVGAGEAAVCYILGVPFMIAVDRIRRRSDLFRR